MAPPRFDQMAFPVGEAASLAGLSERQVRAWQDLLRPSFSSGLYTFRDLVGLRTMRRLQEDHGVSTQGLRRAATYLRQHSQTPWSQLRVGVGPKNRVYMFDPETEDWVSADEARQHIVPIALDHVAAALRKAVTKSRTRPAEKRGEFEQTRGVCAGQIRFAGTRVTVELVLEALRDGLTVAEVLSEFPTLTREDVRAARDVLRGTRKLAAA